MRVKKYQAVLQLIILKQTVYNFFSGQTKAMKVRLKCLEIVFQTLFSRCFSDTRLL